MIRNQNIARQILEMIDTLIDAAKYSYSLATENEYLEFEKILNDMIKMLQSINNTIVSINEKNMNDISLACESITNSINRIIQLSYSRATKVLEKIEFELIPLIEEIKLNFYFWGIAYQDKELIKDYYENKMISLSANKYIDEAEKMGKYKYDLSIIITGYNKLEYTKLCIESLIEYMPKSINYELILRNHGSTDNTKEYFESICPTKQLDVLKNGGGANAVMRIVEGKYNLNISNDVIVTENAISNMIKCMESDEKIAWVVPTTPNVSNFQTIRGEYNDIDEMHEFCKKNNVNDFYRWEQRSRLCNPIELVRSSICFSSKGIGYGRYYYSENIFSFCDDVISSCMRRKGYKMMLAKDAYCYHFGSITLKDELLKYKDKEGNRGQEVFFNEGKQEFFNTFGIDPWGTGFCWDSELFKYLPCNDIEHVDVLGINCGIGSNPLKVKESIKENVHNLDVTTYNVTDEKCYMEDLKGISDVAEYIDYCSEVDSIFTNKKFKYIIFESKLEIYKNPLLIISRLKKRLVEDGIISIKTLDKDLQSLIINEYSNAIQSNDWIILK